MTFNFDYFVELHFDHEHLESMSSFPLWIMTLFAIKTLCDLVT